MVINALICDDDQKCVDQISEYLDHYCYDHSLSYSVKSFTDGMQAIHSEAVYNIAFLDIEIGNVSGLDIAKALKEKNKNIIIFFVTEYEKYIDDAMDLFALRFIKKPVTESRIYKGLDKGIDLINEDEISFYLKDSNKIKNIKSKDIIYVETGNHKTMVFTNSGCYESAQLLDYWEKKLTNICFARPHKSFIVNMEYIDEYKRNEVKLKSGKIVPIAYKRQTEFRKIFWNYLKRRK